MPEPIPSKSLLQSKTFWTNVLLGAAQVSGYLPAKYGVPIQTIANVVLRVLTDSPVTVLPQATN
jgi:hypothetical protein